MPYFDCTLVKRNKCRTVPVTKCTKVPEKQCETKVQDVCVDTPETKCDDIHRRIPHTLKRQKPVEVRTNTTNSLFLEFYTMNHYFNFIVIEKFF